MEGRLRTEKAPERESGKAKKMSSGGPKIGSGGGGGGSGGGGGFRARIDHYLYSGDKKHVAAGIAIISIIFGIPWVLMNRGSSLFLTSLRYLHLTRDCISPLGVGPNKI